MANSGTAHPEIQRLLQALRERGLISGPHEATQLASLLNISPQLVTNWKRRGLSKEAKLDIQDRFGISATWLSTGDRVHHVAASSTAPLQANEPGAAAPYAAQSHRSRREKHLQALVAQLDDTALAILIDKAGDLLKEYARPKAKAS